jgi:hypothetical protein
MAHGFVPKDAGYSLKRILKISESRSALAVEAVSQQPVKAAKMS